ncbi:MAG TPA: hypothetical protein VJH06_03155 [Candidatus Paceibacterota bacterium]
MNIEGDQIDSLLIATYSDDKDESADRYMDYYIDQYRIYLHIFNNTSDRRQKTNEFFLGINTAIMGIMGYFETKDLPNAPVISILVPFVGIAICFCWYRLILSYTQLNRVKFKIIHTLEKKLPANIFESEWHLLGKGKDKSKYFPISHTERFIPITFILLYVIIVVINSPLLNFLNF